MQSRVWICINGLQETGMSSDQRRAFTSALRVDIGLSPVLRLVLLCCYGFTGVLCLTLALEATTRIVLCLGSMSYGLYLARYPFGSKSRFRVKRIEYSASQGWQLLLSSGDRVPGSLQLPVFVTRFLVIARFGQGLFPEHTVVIPADAVEFHAYRHLRVRLLQSAHGHRNRA